MYTRSDWWPWQGELCRRAYLLTKGTPWGWHTFNLAGFCVRCHQHTSEFDEVCREFLAAIPAVTSPPHDPPPPPGRLL